MLFSIRSYTTHNKKTCDICAILSCNLNNLSLIDNACDREFLRGISNPPSVQHTTPSTRSPVTLVYVYPLLRVVLLRGVALRFHVTLHACSRLGIIIIIIIPSIPVLVYALISCSNKKTNAKKRYNYSVTNSFSNSICK
jgi:hypothetical protein